uniref:Pre-mRNA splicing Prp18-interacting factor n=1 Tax=Tanacetum cinerariifolium TaxID=118510 RepID=A0A6L2KF39_TANCI|nr:hypothetical protein [Tanacetum cinerariifolium]
MSSFNHQECLGCGQPYEGSLRGGFCWFCASNSEISFSNDPNLNSFNDSQNLSDYSPQPQYETYPCELSGNNSHYGYDCPPRFPFVYEQEPCYNQNFTENYYPYNLPSFRCCDNFEGPHESFQCQSMNQNFFEPNSCNEHNSSSFDQYQPLQSSVTQQLPQRSNENIKQEMANLIKNNRILLNNNIFSHQETKLLPQFFNDSRTIKQAIQQEQEEQAAQSFTPYWNFSMIDDEKVLQSRENFMKAIQTFLQKFNQDTNELFQKLLEDLKIIIEELSEYINSSSWNHPTFIDNDEDHSILYKEYLENYFNAVAPILPIEEPEYSLSMGYEHLSTTSETESNEVIESSVKNFVPIPSEYEVTSDDESGCDVPVKDESSLVFTTFSNPIFDDNDDFTSTDDESLSNEDVPMENFKSYSNPLFDDEEINSDEIDPHYFNAESDCVDSLSNHDTLIDSSLKFDYLEEFFGALMPTSIADEERIKREHEEYISLMEKLFIINSFPHPLENFHANTIIKTHPTSPILIEDSDSLMEEIDIFTGTDDLLPPGIESDDYDSEEEIHVLEELLVDDSIPFPENESSYSDHHDDPPFPRPPQEPPDVEFYFDFEPNSGEVISAVMNNIDELNEDECFDPGGEIDVFANVEDAD